MVKLLKVQKVRIVYISFNNSDFKHFKILLALYTIA